MLNSTFAIYGLARSGIAVGQFLDSLGLPFYIFDANEDKISNALATYKNALRLELDFIPKLDYALLSPGIDISRSSCSIIKNLLENKIKITCDIELFIKLKTSSKFIGVTGSNGKSTTVAMIDWALQQLGANAAVGGNNGIAVFTLPNVDFYVLEISSFQLDLLYKSSFDIAVLLNITSDHLDRYGTISNYQRSKSRIFKDAGLGIGLIDTEGAKNVMGDSALRVPMLRLSCNTVLKNGLSLVNGVLWRNAENIGNLYNPKLFGVHNFENLLAAFATLDALDFKTPDIIKSLETFHPLEHRLEPVTQFKNIMFINDSKATSIEAAKSALRCFANIRWILGGRTKLGGLNGVQDSLPSVLKAYLIGEASQEFADFLSSHEVECEVCQTIENACIRAFTDAVGMQGDEFPQTILLSPACSSFDQFNDFEHRGKVFKECARAIVQLN